MEEHPKVGIIHSLQSSYTNKTPKKKTIKTKTALKTVLKTTTKTTSKTQHTNQTFTKISLVFSLLHSTSKISVKLDFYWFSVYGYQFMVLSSWFQFMVQFRGGLQNDANSYVSTVLNLAVSNLLTNKKKATRRDLIY